MDLGFFSEGEGYNISFGDSHGIVSGNKLLVNRFQITLFDEGMFFETSDGEKIEDDFGGRIIGLIGTPKTLSDIGSIKASLYAAVKNTVDSIKSDEEDEGDGTEMLEDATVESVSVVKDVVVAVIRIKPVKIDGSSNLYINIPIVGR
jgi:hypothetical protein